MNFRCLAFIGYYRSVLTSFTVCETSWNRIYWVEKCVRLWQVFGFHRFKNQNFETDLKELQTSSGFHRLSVYTGASLNRFYCKWITWYDLFYYASQGSFKIVIHIHSLFISSHFFMIITIRKNNWKIIQYFFPS